MQKEEKRRNTAENRTIFINPSAMHRRIQKQILTMSKINLEAPFTAFRGKICKHSKIIFAQRGQTQYTSQICNPRTKAYSEEEIARQGKFKQAVANANAALADSTQKAAYEEAFGKQSKYKTLRGYVIAMEYAKLG